MGGLLTSVLKECVARLVIESRHAAFFIPRTIFHAMRCGTLPLKDRHMYTRAGRLRLRYIAIMAAAFLGLSLANTSFTTQEGFEIAQAQASVGDVAAAHLAPAPAVRQEVASNTTVIAVQPAPVKPPTPHQANYTRKLTIKSGDTLSDLLETVSFSQTSDAMKALKGHIDPKSLKAGEDVTVHYNWAQNLGEHVSAMEFAPTPLTRVVLRQGVNGAFSVQKIEKSLSKQTRAAKATIRSSLYVDLRKAGVPDSIIAEFIKAYSYNVDFQRDIWAGDRVELLYNVEHTDDNDYVRGNDLIYAALYMRGKPSVIFRFENQGTVEYFDEKGNPVKKAFMRTPIDGARVTSGFGSRRHPVLGYTRMHKGVDFGAPTGTPIFAAGDGTVETAGWSNGYGKLVLIRHNGTYETAYGHMSAINVKPGQRVKQGQVIGRVGMTGIATGPHLHFEVRVNHGQVNPLKVANMSIGNKLGGKQLARFKSTLASAKSSLDTIVASGAAAPKLASLPGE